MREFGKGHSRQDYTPAQRATQTREMLQTLDLLTHHAQGKKIKRNFLSAGFQQVQHQQDANSKLQGNSGIIPGKVRNGSGSCPQVFHLKERIQEGFPTHETGTKTTGQNTLVTL